MAAFMRALSLSSAGRGRGREAGRGGRRLSDASILSTDPQGVLPVPDDQEQQPTSGVDRRLVSELLVTLAQLRAGQERMEGKIDVVQREVSSLGAVSGELPLMQEALSVLTGRSLQEGCEVVGTGGGSDPVRAQPASHGAAAQRVATAARRAGSSLQRRVELLKYSSGCNDEMPGGGAKLRRKGTRAGGTAYFDATTSRGGAAPQPLVMHPESPRRLLFDLLAVAMLQFDLLLVPYALAWDLRFEGPLLVAAWAAAGFWLLDLVSGFFTGFYRNGELEMRRGQIRRHYVRTTLLLNALPLACDAVSLSLALGGLAGQANLFRVLDLARIHRLWSISSRLVQRSLSDKRSMVIQGLQLVYGMLWMNHMLSCAWYAIARWAPSDTGDRWFDSLQVPGGEEDQFQKSSAVYQYFTAFHFSIAQLFAGGLEGVSPLSTLERIFNISTLLFGMLFVSSLVGALSTTMMQIKLRNEESAGKLRELRQFLSEQSIHAETAVRIQKQVTQRMSKKKRLTDKDVSALTLLSSSLRWALRSEIFGPTVIGYPLFRLCQSIAPDILERLCGEAVDTKEMSLGDVLFEAGTFANDMFLLTTGKLQYKYTPPEKHDSDLEQVEVEEEPEVVETVSASFSSQWLCEIALWTQWAHFGTALAWDACELLVINATKTLNIALRHTLIKDIFLEYGKEFYKRAVSAENPNEQPTDIRVASTSYDELFFTMNHETRRVMSQVVVAEIQARGYADTRKVARLVEEVDDGRSCVMMNGDGEVERAVAITVLQLSDAAGNLLVQVAKTAEDAFTPVCQLPGVKQRGSEAPSEAIQRLLTDLSPLVPAVRIKRSELHRQVVGLKDSPTYGTPTKYLRTNYTASLEQPFNPIGCTYAPVDGGEPLAGAESQGIPRPSLPKLAVYKMEEGLCANNAYAWMPPDDFRYYCSFVGRPVLQKWIASLGSLGAPRRASLTERLQNSTGLTERFRRSSVTSQPGGSQHLASASLEYSDCASDSWDAGALVPERSRTGAAAAEGAGSGPAPRPPEGPPPPGAIEEQPPERPELHEASSRLSPGWSQSQSITCVEDVMEPTATVN